MNITKFEMNRQDHFISSDSEYIRKRINEFSYITPITEGRRSTIDRKSRKKRTKSKCTKTKTHRRK